MSSYLRIVSRADGRPSPDDGRLIEAADVDAFNGRGSMTTTLDVSRAIAFDSAHDAILFWQQRSTVKPVRLDGKPNRPLTAYTVEVVR